MYVRVNVTKMSTFGLVIGIIVVLILISVVAGYLIIKQFFNAISPKRCTTGDIDIGANVCWTCPPGTSRSAAPVNDYNACVDAGCTNLHPGSYPHLATGDCYTCPPGHSRTGWTIDSPAACERVETARATNVGKRVFPVTDVMTRQTCAQEFTNDVEYGFWDGLNDSCWTCPAGYRRTIAPVNQWNACVNGLSYKWASERRKGAGLDGLTYCPAGSFPHFADNKCYTCPAGTDRTAALIGAPDACAASCDKLYPGSFEHATTGTCFKCPDGFVRSASGIDSADACTRLVQSGATKVGTNTRRANIVGQPE